MIIWEFTEVLGILGGAQAVSKTGSCDAGGSPVVLLNLDHRFLLTSLFRTPITAHDTGAFYLSLID